MLNEWWWFGKQLVLRTRCLLNHHHFHNRKSDCFLTFGTYEFPALWMLFWRMFAVTSDWLTSIQWYIMISHTFALRHATWEFDWSLLRNHIKIGFMLLVPGIAKSLQYNCCIIAVNLSVLVLNKQLASVYNTCYVVSVAPETQNM